MLTREVHVGEHVIAAGVHHRRELGVFLSERIGDLVPLLARRLGTFLGEDRLQQCHDRRALLRAGMGERVAHPMNPAALKRGVEHLGRRRPQALVIVGDDEANAAQAAIGERT
jgi:hypothetical protein